MSMALSLSDRRSVTRNASTPSRYDTTLTARVQSVPHRQRSQAEGVEDARQWIPDVGKGKGACDRVQAPLIFTATLAYALRPGAWAGLRTALAGGGLERLRQAEMVNHHLGLGIAGHHLGDLFQPPRSP